MSDGMIVLTSALFAEGNRPAIDYGQSMSIVGGKSQLPILKSLSSTLRLEYQQYTELLSLSKLQSTLSTEAERTLARGHAIVRALQQYQYEPVGLAELVIILYALREGHLEKRPENEQDAFHKAIFKFTKDTDARLIEDIETQKELSPDVTARVDALLNAYFSQAQSVTGS
jgi:F-type H+-transporting ATPase subunit alpha